MYVRSLTVQLGLTLIVAGSAACDQQTMNGADPVISAADGGTTSAGTPALASAGAAPRAVAGRGVTAGAGAGGAGVTAEAPRPAAVGSGGAGAAAAGRGGGVAAGGGGAEAGAPGFTPCPPGAACKILPLGDSITYGIGYDGGYRVELFRKAHAAGKQITFTGSLSNGPMMVDGVAFPRNNEGHSGWKIDQLLPLIPSPALQTPPHIVLLMIGTNDIAQNDALADAPKRLAKLLDQLSMSAPEALTVVAKLIPLSRSTAVQAYNDALAAVVQERAAGGKHVLLVDQFTGFPVAELGDGVHPNQKGYERMAGVWYEAIAKLLR